MSAELPPPDIPSFEIDVAVLPNKGFPVELRAGEDERKRIAAACDVEGFDLLEADLLATRWRRDGVELRGEIRAVVRQQCVVTLESLVNELCEKVAMTFLPPGSEFARVSEAMSNELLIDPDGPDLPEIVENGVIDLWPVVVECLLLAIDPFPRAPGAALPETEPEDEEDVRESPFAVLKDFKTGPETD